jgi:integrase/recombinase XerD
MSELRRHAEDYLRLRQAPGFKLTLHGPLLARFTDYLDAAGAPGPTTELAVSSAQLPPGVQPIVWARRLSMVRGFARYLQAIDPATEVPPTTSLLRATSARRHTCGRKPKYRT